MSLRFRRVEGRIASTVMDHALRKKTQEEFARVFQRVPDLLCTVSAHAHLHRLNAGWRRLSGCMPTGIENASHLIKDAVPEDHPNLLANPIQASTRSGIVVRDTSRGAAGSCQERADRCVDAGEG